MTRIGKDHFANRDPDPIFDLKNNDNSPWNPDPGIQIRNVLVRIDGDDDADPT